MILIKNQQEYDTLREKRNNMAKRIQDMPIEEVRNTDFTDTVKEIEEINAALEAFDHNAPYIK